MKTSSLHNVVTLAIYFCSVALHSTPHKPE